MSDYSYEKEVYFNATPGQIKEIKLTNKIADYAINCGGSFVRCHPIEHLTKIRCNKETLDKIQAEVDIITRFQLNIKRINRWWYSVAFIDRNIL